MGLDLRDRPAAARTADAGRMLRSADSWDFVLSGNRHSTLVWERVFPSGFTTLEYGLPRNDVFARATSADVARLRQTMGIPEGSVAILYAPTFRDYRRDHRPALDPERLLHRLGPRFVLLTRSHPSFGEPLARTTGDRVIDVSDHPSVEAVCLASDALVTDFSSLMFDYANLDRPVVVYADDWEAYEATRGTYFDVRDFPPGAVARDEEELADIFATGHWCGSRSQQRRRAFRERFCPHDDGRAAERIVRRVCSGERLAAVRGPAGRPAPGPARHGWRAHRTAHHRPGPRQSRTGRRTPLTTEPPEPPEFRHAAQATHRPPRKARALTHPHAYDAPARDGDRGPRERAECPASASSSPPSASPAACPRPWTPSSPSPSATSR